MNKVKTFVGTTVSTVAIASLIAAPAYACHPQGMIVKSVQNMTAKTGSSDANQVSTAVTATTGDVLTYTVSVANNGAPAANQDDDLFNTTITDNLPAGVELVSNPSQRTITEKVGTLTPGKSVVKTYSVKVTSTTDGDTITNKACYTGDSKVAKNAQNGCDVAIVKVHVTPAPTPDPTPTPTPSGSGQVEAATTELPNTGASTFVAPAIGVLTATAGYILHLRSTKRRVQA